MRKILEISKEELFDRLIKAKCKFKKKNELYYINCNNRYFIGQLKDFKNVEVFELELDEVKFFKLCATTFHNASFEIIKDNNGNKNN